MNDRQRWMDGQATELERVLLGAVAHERPNRKLVRRMRVGLGLAGSLISLKAAAAVLSVVTAVTGIAVTVAERPIPEPPAATRSVVAVPAPLVVEEAEPQAPPAPKDVKALPEETAELAVKHAADPVKRAPTQAAGAAVGQSAARTNDLRDEIRVLDRARVALREGDPRRALSELARYAERYPQGTFRQEAMVLRVEALKQSGDKARAASLAREFASRHADSPHVDRVQRIVGSETMR